MPDATPFRIIQISDLHGNTSIIDLIAGEIAAADLLVFSGDLTHDGGKRQAAGIVEKVLGFDVPIVAVPGNWDRPGAADYLKESGISVDGMGRDRGGFRVCGLGGSLPAPVPTPTVHHEHEFAGLLDKLLAEYASPDIIVLHQPPADSALDMIQDGTHVGSRAVRQFIERSGAKVCLTGHIHDSPGKEMIGETLTVNPGSAMHGRYAVIELHDRSATAELKTTSV